MAKLINQENVIYKKKLLEKNIEKAKNEVKSMFEKYKLIEKLVDEITDTDSKISDKVKAYKKDLEIKVLESSKDLKNKS